MYVASISYFNLVMNSSYVVKNMTHFKKIPSYLYSTIITINILINIGIGQNKIK